MKKELIDVLNNLSPEERKEIIIYIEDIEQFTNPKFIKGFWVE